MSGTWTEDCSECGLPVQMTDARCDAGLFNVHYGCAGYPYCTCATKHRGECEKPTDAAVASR